MSPLASASMSKAPPQRDIDEMKSAASFTLLQCCRAAEMAIEMGAADTEGWSVVNP